MGRRTNDPGAGLTLVTQYLELTVGYLADECPELPELRAERCQEIEDARADGDRRYYAHVDCEFEHAGQEGVVCFAHDVGKLTPRKQAGLALHEVGHLLAELDDTEPGPEAIAQAQEIYPAGRVREEAAANQAIADVLDIDISYGRDQVQQITHAELQWLENQ